MGKRHPKYNLVKIHRNYTVDDAARLLGVHKNTVGNWMKLGLPVLNEKRPFLILGQDLKEFLKTRRAKTSDHANPSSFTVFDAAPQSTPLEAWLNIRKLRTRSAIWSRPVQSAVLP